MLVNDPLVIHGNGEARRDWIYVEDTIRGILALMDAPDDSVHGEIFNLGSGVSTSVLYLAAAIGDILGRKPELEFIHERFGQVQNHISSTDKLQTATGFRAGTSLRDGLEKTIAWYDENREWWKNQTWLKRVPVRGENNRVFYW